MTENAENEVPKDEPKVEEENPKPETEDAAPMYPATDSTVEASTELVPLPEKGEGDVPQEAPPTATVEEPIVEEVPEEQQEAETQEPTKMRSVGSNEEVPEAPEEDKPVGKKNSKAGKKSKKKKGVSSEPSKELVEDAELPLETLSKKRKKGKVKSSGELIEDVELMAESSTIVKTGFAKKVKRKGMKGKHENITTATSASQTLIEDDAEESKGDIETSKQSTKGKKKKKDGSKTKDISESVAEDGPAESETVFGKGKKRKQKTDPPSKEKMTVEQPTEASAENALTSESVSFSQSETVKKKLINKRASIVSVKGQKRKKSIVSEEKGPSEDSSSLSSSTSGSSKSSETKRKIKEKKKKTEETLVGSSMSISSKKKKLSKKKLADKRKPSKTVQIQDVTPTLTESQLMLQELEKMKTGEVEEDNVSRTPTLGETVSQGSAGKKQKKKTKPKKLTTISEEPEPTAKKPKRMSNKQMAEWLHHQELEAQKRAEEERLRLEKERDEMIEQEMKDRYEQINRKEQLQPSIDLANVLEEEDALANLEIADAEEWIRYLRCDGLPKVTNSGEMYTYLYRLNLEREEVDIEKASAKTNEILGLLSTLEKRITNPLVDDTKENIAAWKEIRQEFRKIQQDRLDVATYSLLRDVFGNLVRRSIPLADYSRIEENFIYCLWVAVCLPIPMPNPRRPPK